MESIKLKCVADTSTLIRLRKGGVIHLLGEMFETIFIPLAVQDECKDAKTKKAIENKLFKVVPVENVLSIENVHEGELEAISLSIELGVDLILLDDVGAIKKADQYHLISLSAFDVLLSAKKKGLIKSAKQVLDVMSGENEKIDEISYADVLLRAGESL